MARRWRPSASSPRALHQRCLDRGITFHLGADVTAIRTEGSGVAGVTLSTGERVDADVVVSDADSTHLYQHLIAHPGARTPLRRLRRATPSLAGFVPAARVAWPHAGLQHHNVLFPADYDAEFDAIFGSARVQWTTPPSTSAPPTIH